VRRYAGWFDVWTDFPAVVRRLAAGAQVTRVCDLGGGANPILTRAEIAERGLRYEILDASSEELAKAPEGYTTVQADALDPELGRRHGPYDLVASSFTAEHVPDPARFHANVFAALAPGGYAVHAFPTLYEPTVVANRVVPERLTEPLLRRVQPGARRRARTASSPPITAGAAGRASASCGGCAASASRSSSTSATSATATSAPSSRSTGSSSGSPPRSSGIRCPR
jgi:SAM-dependent methyltransferase